ncbi:MAG: hypothetical protein IKL55_01960 [Clostridia bacterium]|nr:hypothetical protein [Clostridia bacterium]
MERTDIKRILKEMGVAEALLEMPAVVEPIYKEMMEKTEKDLRNYGRLNVDENGDFSFGGKKVKLKENGGAKITYRDAIITTNEYGIEIAYSDGNSFDIFSNIQRENGTVISLSGNNGDGSYYERTSLDNGSWSIGNASGIDIEENSSHSKPTAYVPVDLSVEEALEDFDSVSKSVIEHYPQTAKWYQATRAEMQAVAEKEVDPNEQNKRKIAFLENRVRQLEYDKKELLERNSRLTGMLEKALDFMGQVKRSPIGKVFFAKGLKKYEEESNKLPSGRDDRE